MAKRVFVIHGWEGFPEEGWFPWLKRELEKEGFEVHVPTLPEPKKPRIQNWVPFIAQVVGEPDAETYFVGHSIGCQAIARYLEGLPEGVKVGGIVFVGGFFKHLAGLEDDPEVQATDRHWLTTPLDFAKVKSHLPKSVAVFSDNDPWVPLDNQDDFKEKLGSKIVIDHKKGHFSGSDGITELPSVLTELLKLTE